MVSLKAPLLYRFGTEPRTGFGLMLRKGDFMIDKGDHKGAVYDDSKSGKGFESKYDIWLSESGLSRSMLNPSGTKDLLGWSYEFRDNVSPKMYGTRLGIMEMINGYLKEHCSQFGFYLSRSPMVWDGDVLSVMVEVVPGDGIVVDEEFMVVFEDSLEELSNHVLALYKDQLVRLGAGSLYIDFRVLNLLNLCAKYPGWSEARDNIMESVEESSLYQSLPKLQKSMGSKSAKSISSEFMSLDNLNEGSNSMEVNNSVNSNTQDGSTNESKVSSKSDGANDKSEGEVNNADNSEVKNIENVNMNEVTDQVDYDDQLGGNVKDVNFHGINLTARGVVSVMLMSSLWPVPWVLGQMVVDMLVKTMKHREVMSDFEDKLEKVSSNREFGLLHNEIRNVASLNVNSRSNSVKSNVDGVDDINGVDHQGNNSVKSSGKSSGKVNSILRKGGYRGYRVVVKGPLDGARRTFSATLRGGILPLSSVSVGVVHSRTIAPTKIGTRGVTVTYAY